nr:MAG TPA: proteasome-activating nucleotidase [Caudoviricetes sp.]
MDDIRELKREYNILKQKYKRLEEKCRDISSDKLKLLNQIKELKMELHRAKKAGSV